MKYHLTKNIVNRSVLSRYDAGLGLLASSTIVKSNAAGQYYGFLEHTEQKRSAHNDDKRKWSDADDFRKFWRRLKKLLQKVIHKSEISHKILIVPTASFVMWYINYFTYLPRYTTLETESLKNYQKRKNNHLTNTLIAT